ncbi:MAG: 50S ribosomal protein L17 [Myxococcales bacterium]|nr:MAG: 50S ribosomal protein L17 [Myxococcales bacterium]
MRHQKAGRKFGRNTSHRRAMFRNLVGNLVLHERIETTDAKAKELRRIAERLVSQALRLGDNLIVDVGKLKTPEEREGVMASRLNAQRQVARFLPKAMAKTKSDGDIEDVDLVYKLFHDIAPRYLDRVKAGKGGGYTRIIKGKLRRGDNAPMSYIEFVSGGKAAAAPKPKKSAVGKSTEVAAEAKEAAPKKAKATTAKASEKSAAKEAAPKKESKKAKADSTKK